MTHSCPTRRSSDLAISANTRYRPSAFKASSRVVKNSSLHSEASHKIGEASLCPYASSCAMVSSRLTDLRGKAAMVSGARPPDPITVGVAGSYLEDQIGRAHV